jgi:hypothetical protein
MVAMAVDHPMAAPPVRTGRDVHCDGCDRFLTQTVRFVALPPGTVWTRVKCQGCNRWRWVDLATGAVADAPIGPA